MTLTIKRTSKFKRDLRKILQSGCDISEFAKVVELLANRQTLPEKYRDHALTGEWRGFRECHIKPDWLLIYTVNESDLILTLVRTGSHSTLFN